MTGPTNPCQGPGPRRAPLKVINLFGAPSRGKSATRAGLFWLMKAHHLNVEEVSEYAKYLVLRGSTWQLQEEQLSLFARQHHQHLVIERSGFDYAVTDSPLHLCPFYAEQAPEHAYAALEPLVDEAYARSENFNFFLTRDLAGADTSYEDRGRRHNAQASARVEQALHAYLARKGIVCTPLEVDLLTPWRILAHVLPQLTLKGAHLPTPGGTAGN